jgi:hypothetical protein
MEVFEKEKLHEVKLTNQYKEEVYNVNDKLSD